MYYDPSTHSHIPLLVDFEVTACSALASISFMTNNVGEPAWS